MIEINFYEYELIRKHFRGFNREVLVPETIKVLNGLEDYWPLTVRQVYYRLVAAQIIENHLNRYKAVSVLLTKLRERPIEIVPWKVIEDRTRRVSDKRGWESVKDFAEFEAEQFLGGYNRCLVQNQQNYVEIFVEKDALAPIFENQAWPYCVRVVTCKGQLGSSTAKEYAVRAKTAIDKGQKPVILHFGDLDPTGARIPMSISKKLKVKHSIKVDMRVIALTPAQAKKLPSSIEALKIKDPNYKWFVRNFGKKAVELDALHPERLKELAIAGLSDALDIEDMEQQQKIEKRERTKLEKAKRRILEVITKEKLI